jgi:Sec-independent protein translocase protein TatA
LSLGPKRLPESGRAPGRGIRKFKDTISGHYDKLDQPAPPQARKELNAPRERDTI